MDGDRFDDFVRGIATPQTRRRLLGGFAGVFLGAFGLGESGLAAKFRGPGETCRGDGDCIAGARCLKDRRGRLYCTCNKGTKACGVTCIPETACCRDADCASLNDACTAGVCVAGTCTSQPKRNGVTCSGGKCCDGACTTCCHGVGQCAPCQTVADCAGHDTDCVKRTCIGGFCGTSNVQAGTAASVQTVGNCKKIVCNGTGGTTEITDNLNTPADDSNPCTYAACVNGQAAQLPVAARTECNANGGKVCNSSGQCIACLAPSDCPGTNTDCLTITCTNGACGEIRTPERTQITAQTQGDCKRVECDGLGGTIEVNDNNDAPISSDPCIDLICVSGTPTQSYVSQGTECGPNLICDGAGSCVGCVDPDDCPEPATVCITRTCSSGVCGTSFAAARSACDDHDGALCDGQGLCVQCLTPLDCPGDDTECQSRTCQSGRCGMSFTSAGTSVSTQSPGDCQRNACDGQGTVVSVDDNDDVPDDDGNQCTVGTCVEGEPTQTPVSDGNECDQGGGSVCADGVCVKVNGVECVTGLECLSGYCVDAVCCDSVCSGLCQGCTTTLKGTGSDGICGPIAEGTDPHNECPGSRSCDGNGTCDGCDTVADCPGETTECQTITCTDGLCGVTHVQSGVATTVQTSGDCQRTVCDGSGGTTTIPDNDDRPDDENQCTENLCNEGEVDHSPLPMGTECKQNGGAICDGNGACVKQKLRGSTCSQAIECSSGFCTDGVCCDTACDLTCRACTSALKGSGSDGVCGYIAFGTDPRNECPGDSVCQEFGECSGCTNASQCLGETTECQRPSCVEETCGMDYSPYGTRVTIQTSGNCTQDVCDGAGKVITIPDNDDPPPTGENQCILNVCSNGESTQVSAPAGAACTHNGGSVCDGAGNCIGCIEPGDCPGAGNECMGASCVAGQCGTSIAEVGTLCSNGNKVCDGSGNCLSQFFRGSPCALNIQCTSGFCTDGYCCDIECGAQCRACNVSGREGLCTITIGASCGDSGQGICGEYADCLTS